MMRYISLFFLVLFSFGCIHRGSDQNRPDPVPPRTGPDHSGASQAEAKRSIRLVVYLRDGSQLVGTVQKPMFPFQTSYGNLDVPLDKIRSVIFSDSSGASTVEFSNGDLLHGRFGLSTFPLEGALGKLELPTQGIAKLLPFGDADVITAGLVAYYPLHGSTADESGHGRNGVNHGAVPAKDRFGNPDHAYSFNGAGAYIALPDGLVSPDVAAFTISLWTLARSMNDTRFVAYIGANSGEASLSIKDQQFSFIVTLSGKGGYVVSAPAELNRFIHLLCVYRKGTSIALWVDGRPAGETPIPNGSIAYGGTDHSSTFGSYAPEQQDHARSYHLRTWDGIIDDVRIYNRALEPEEIATLSRE
jgi:hypothetical protein